MTNHYNNGLSVSILLLDQGDEYGRFLCAISVHGQGGSRVNGASIIDATLDLEEILDIAEDPHAYSNQIH